MPLIGGVEEEASLIEWKGHIWWNGGVAILSKMEEYVWWSGGSTLLPRFLPSLYLEFVHPAYLWVWSQSSECAFCTKFNPTCTSQITSGTSTNTPLQLTKYVAPPFHKQAKYISPWFHYESYRGGALGHDANVSMNCCMKPYNIKGAAMPIYATLAQVTKYWHNSRRIWHRSKFTKTTHGKIKLPSEAYRSYTSPSACSWGQVWHKG